MIIIIIKINGLKKIELEKNFTICDQASLATWCIFISYVGP